MFVGMSVGHGFVQVYVFVLKFPSIPYHGNSI